MATSPGDDAFAKYLLQMRTLTQAQIDAARTEQANRAAAGEYWPLAEVLVRQGVITSDIRDNVEKLTNPRGPAQLSKLGQFNLVKKLGEGGMGTVYLADDTISKRKVALKVLPRKLSDDLNALTRFKREAKAMAKLNHENIVAAFSTGEEKGFNYLVMELCEGEPLDKKLKRKHYLDWDRAINITFQTAQGLKHAHEQGIIHRDIKPANIYVLKNGVVKILDMGLSKNLDGNESSFNTQSGVVLGTPHYIAPEQATGERDIDGRADIYSLGATLYNMVTGQTPFQGSSSAVIMLKHINEKLPNPQDIREGIPDGVVLVIEKMMAKAPADRYANCAELLKDLELLSKGKMPQIAVPMDEFKSSIAMAKAPIKKGSKPPSTGRMRTTGSYNQKRDAGDQAFVGPAPVARDEDDDEYHTPVPSAASRKIVFIAAGTMAALIAVVIFALFSGKSKTPTVGKENPPVKPPETHTPEPPSVVIQPKNENESWLKSVAALAVDEQLEKVMERLKTLNPGFDGEYKKTLVNGQLDELDIRSFAIQDITPLQVFTKLRQLTLEGDKEGNEIQRSRISDLSALKDLPLTKLSVAYSTVRDLAPLREMKELATLNISYSLVEDLTPLKGLPLTWLNCRETKVTNLEALRGLKLNYLDASDTQIFTIEPLHGMPLRHLSIRKTKVADLTALAGMPLDFLDVQFLELANLDALKDVPLKNLSLPRNLADYAQLKKQFPDLRHLNGQPIERWEHGPPPPDHQGPPFAGDGPPNPRPPPPPRDNPPPPDGTKPPPPNVTQTNPPPPATTTPQPEAAIAPNAFVALDMLPAFNSEFISLPGSLSTLQSNFYGAFNWETAGRIKGMGRKAEGVPDDGRVEIPQAKGNFFQLNVASQRNSIRLTAPNGAQPLAVTFVLPRSQVQSCTKLAVLHSGPVNTATVGVLLRYDSGPADEQIMGAWDWRAATTPKPPEISTGALTLFGEGARQPVAMHSTILRLDAHRALCSVTFSMKAMDPASSGTQWGHAAIFALSILPAYAAHLPPEETAPVKARALDDVSEEWVKSVQPLPAKEQFKRVTDKLRELNPPVATNLGSSFKEEVNQVGELTLSSDRLENIAPLRALSRLRKLDCTGVSDAEKGGRPCPVADIGSLRKLTLLQRLNLSLTSVEDLSPIKGLALAELDVSYTLVADLAPLKGMALRSLNCAHTAVDSLAPLAGTKLEKLNVAGTLVSDLAPLRGAPLRELNVARTNVSNLAVLGNVPLEVLDLSDSKVPVDFAAKLIAFPLKALNCGDDFERDAAQILKQCRTLGTVNGMTMAEYRFKYPDEALAENFEKLDLQRPPANYNLLERGSLSIVEKLGRGKVLRIDNRNTAAATPGIEVALDASKLKGRTVVLSALVWCPAGYTPISPQEKPLFYLTCKAGKIVDSTVLYVEPAAATLDWTQYKTTFVVPAIAQTATLVFKVSHVPVEIFVDELRVEVLPVKK